MLWNRNADEAAIDTCARGALDPRLSRLGGGALLAHAL